MKNLTESFKLALESETTTLTWCWLIERTDGEKLGFTSFDLPLTIDSITYEPFTGFAGSADDSSEGLERNNSQSLGGVLNSEQINEADLLGGKYTKAKITCFIVDPTNLPATLDDDPPTYLHKYTRTIARVTLTDRGFSFETRGLDYEFEASLGKQTSKFCSYDLGDSNCGVDLSNYAFTQTIASVINRQTFEVTGNFNTGQFDRGKITFTTGQNAYTTRDIAKSEGNTITTFQPFPYPIEVGEIIILVQGCGKTLYDCIARYNNVLNCDCDPHIPTVEQATT